MRILLIIILFIFANSDFAETTEVEVKEARTLVTATEKVSISSEIASVSYTHLTLPTKA
mgnify:CR=1 FL=1